MTADEIRKLGGGASNLFRVSGSTRASIRQYDLGAFVQDDWKARSNVAVSLGLRYEAQTNVNDFWNVAPRFSVAWSPAVHPKENPHTVLRAGFGIFYDRLDATVVLGARFSQRPHLLLNVNNPALLDQFPALPPISSLSSFSVPDDIVHMATDLKSPVTTQATFSVEQELPYKTRLSVSATAARTLHTLRMIDLFSSSQQDLSVVGGALGRPLLIDSGGRLKQRQLKVDLTSAFRKRVTLAADYVVNRTYSDTDGFGTPVNDGNGLENDFGRSGKDIHQNLTLTGSINAPWGIRLSPFIVASSNRPFNIITGRFQGTNISFTERPALATDPADPGILATRFGFFYLNPQPGQLVIPRNFGQGPGFLSASLRLSKDFLFGDTSNKKENGSGTSPGNEGQHRLTLSVQVINLTNHLNPGAPDGSLRSSTFGQSSSLAPGFNFGGEASTETKQSDANRRIEGQIRFTF